jgi:hypothetical protein
MKRVTAMALVASSSILASGCSWTFSRPPQRPDHTSRAYAAPLCRPGYVAPLIDTYQAAGGGVLALYMLGSASGSEADTLGVLAAITAGVSAVWGASAAYGFKQARACRELRAELTSRMPAPMPAPVWIAPSQPVQPRIDADVGDQEIVVEQDVDVDDDQIEVRTRIRPAKPAKPPAR